jgi:hypothetical protein
MSGAKENNEMKEISFDEVVKDLQEGKNPSTKLSKDMKLRCVAYFNDRGLSAQEIGALLKMSDRNVRRMIADLNKKYAEEIDSNWVVERFGEFYNSFRMQYKRALRMSYAEGASFNEKQQSLYLAWRIQREFLQTLHSVGFTKKSHGFIEERLTAQENQEHKKDIKYDNSEEGKLLKEIAELRGGLPGILLEPLRKQLEKRSREALMEYRDKVREMREESDRREKLTDDTVEESK